jgi:virginiamycin B lyase
MKRFLVLTAIVPLLATAAAAQEVKIQEWQVPWGAETRPRDPFIDAQQRVWFVGQVGNYIAYLNPASGEFKRYEIEEGTNPHNLIVDARGVWYAGNRNARIGRLDPSTGQLKTFPMPDPAVRDPHTLVFDANGNIWFTAQQSGFIGHLDTKSEQIHVMKMPGQRALPYGIRIDRSGRPWFNLFGTNLIGTIDPKTMQLETHATPRPDARTRRIEVTSDQKIWYVDYAAGYLGRFDPVTRQFKEWPAPSGAQSRPYAMAVDASDRIWFVETGVQPNNFVGFDPKTEAFFSVTPIPSGGGAVRHMMFDGRKGEIWFGTDRGTIGKAILP